MRQHVLYLWTQRIQTGLRGGSECADAANHNQASGVGISWTYLRDPRLCPSHSSRLVEERLAPHLCSSAVWKQRVHCELKRFLFGYTYAL